MMLFTVNDMVGAVKIFSSLVARPSPAPNSYTRVPGSIEIPGRNPIDDTERS